mgnify:FL=1
MSKGILFTIALLLLTGWSAPVSAQTDCFPDGTPVGDWFREAVPATLETLGHPFVLTEFGVGKDSTRLQTAAIQAVIDRAAAHAAENRTRTVVIVPKGTFLTASLFLRQGVNLYLCEGAVLKGSDRIGDYPVMETRIEGQWCPYFPALVNADGLTGVKICGSGTIDGNGLEFWKAFWKRRAWNPDCTNKDEQRPRLLFVSNCQDVEVSGLTLRNSPFWSTHYYRCERVKALNLKILAPKEPVPAPSSDAIDIDVCKDFLVKGCFLSVNDDAVVLKGGKGPWADRDPANGANENILIEDCQYDFCHGCLTCGSESIHNRNILLRRIRVHDAARLLWLKMRPDTPQRYEYITLEDIRGDVGYFLYIKPWTQFFDLQGREDTPYSYASHITMRRCDLSVSEFFAVEPDKDYFLTDFTFEDLTIRTGKPAFDPFVITGCKVHHVIFE